MLTLFCLLSLYCVLGRDNVDMWSITSDEDNYEEVILLVDNDSPANSGATSADPPILMFDLKEKDSTKRSLEDCIDPDL